MTSINFDKIICVPDIFRAESQIYANGFFDLVREPIWQATGIKIPCPKKVDKLKINFLEGFNIDRFFSILDIDINDDNFLEKIAENYFSINTEAENYLFQYIPRNSLVFSFEIPPWLAQALKKRGFDFISFSTSPLRFASDLYPAIRTSSPIIYDRLFQHKVEEAEVRLEAAILAANIRKHQLSLESWKNYSFQNLENSLIIIGQQHIDASLIAPGGIRLKFTDFAEEIKNISKGKRLFYKAHPYDLGSSTNELKELESITSKHIELCQLNAYQILSSYENTELLGLSSGMLQEASFFDKKAYTLFRPFIPLNYSSRHDFEKSLLLHFQKILSPEFWHSILAPGRPSPKVSKISFNQSNHARMIFDLWWDYSKVMTWERNLVHESFMRGGGAELRNKVEDLRISVGHQSSNSQITADPENEIHIDSSAKFNGFINISGKNNSIYIEEGTVFSGVVNIHGEGNKLHINRYSRISGKFYLAGNNGSIKIGHNTSFEDVSIVCGEGNNVWIGKDCMFSRRIEIRTSDGHSIVDKESGHRTNISQDIKIGDHVWIGTDCLILKSTEIPDDCVVGGRSVVNKIFKLPGCLIAGNPARVLREKITWQRERKEKFTEEEISSWQGTYIKKIPIR